MKRICLQLLCLLFSIINISAINNIRVDVSDYMVSFNSDNDSVLYVKSIRYTNLDSVYCFLYLEKDTTRVYNSKDFFKMIFGPTSIGGRELAIFYYDINVTGAYGLFDGFLKIIPPNDYFEFSFFSKKKFIEVTSICIKKENFREFTKYVRITMEDELFDYENITNMMPLIREMSDDERFPIFKGRQIILPNNMFF